MVKKRKIGYKFVLLKNAKVYLMLYILQLKLANFEKSIQNIF